MERTIFTQIVNREKDIEAVADGYKTKINHELWLADGLQKDAIQNCWDVRSDKKHGKNWECGFLLMKIDNKEVLCISDKGTTGLNGTKFYTPNELTKILEKISNESQRGEDLACFLNSNWSSKSIEEGGNRGRGKTLFLVASQSKNVFFESLRSTDNSYVFGEFYLDTADKQVKFSLHYDDDGKAMLKSELGEKISPITEYGTKIFILNPDTAVTQAIKSGELISFISNSRWETIRKYEAKIFVDDGNEKKYANLPYWYENELKGVEEKEFSPEIIKDGTEYKIKRLVLRYAPNLNVPDSIRGIAIQRGGMTIERIPAEELVKEQGMTDIYGWLEMESKPLEEEMKIRCEGPEHFNFTWTLNPARYLRNHIQSKIREFAKDLKIIESEQAKKNKIQKTAEEEALKLLTPLFKKLGLFGKHKGKRKKKGLSRKKNEPLRLSVPDMEFPRDDKRVNYGEKINGTYVVPINEFGESILVLVRVFIVSADGKTEMLQEKEINLHTGEGPRIGPDEIAISKKYKAGGYSLRARMIALENKDKILPDGVKIEKGTILYERVNQKFYVEINPPESGPFEFQPKGKDDKSYLFEWEQEGDGYIIYYNELHPRIKPLLNDGEGLRDYFAEQGSLLALQIKLEELIADDDKEDKDFTKLVKGKDASAVYKLFLNRHSEFLWSLKE
ncbi:MAG: hypothetical protein A3C08_01850 [Candidatus Taylorbacteria bacterium RIFCSPHIGHO2_02_FULL_47_18]|uniref:Uncharacterized protein n=1 Tax=Candidatus Taylorbacteria bacterium RIFCSPLOWO2_01_FULL_48_100 TaxID=1802322 RepID=A0A1G2NF66_9BACT|nr:MAG: hypothetical protein A2670_01960 [Candidatus Taylorbacteria bacterium RIFCSPHIGHO2_01_FULL_48_38]OHA28492.1 MAG: hypothetical protein A3C08_01850 [Candidatus Taylorbacteria bacterium RIFCSPHIGHO2_02_FULL_47_18]OHA34728.1 MAG: hypothetical protein A2938_02330 [Candidatus Taylorbacteria bacterium RIFCSPLOWO2_01_FULL_48_100]OHA40246.1 MAG: hypothetical protein A3J31_01555 [Candidatus Taylorbacteria bacterium RIFCSPLOWO2_02_FULL_48_16]OHA45420.1 MAG: hypothetical protein A3H13_01290 [Candid